jgi:hypothetical protein
VVGLVGHKVRQKFATRQGRRAEVGEGGDDMRAKETESPGGTEDELKNLLRRSKRFEDRSRSTGELTAGTQGAGSGPWPGNGIMGGTTETEEKDSSESSLNRLDDDSSTSGSLLRTD